MKRITRFQKEYPERLQYLTDPPAILHVLGELPANEKRTVGIVGARMCSQYGRSQAYYFARELSRFGVQIISGMARGIDCAAHEGALSVNGTTFAVLGCGVDICYPASSQHIYQQMLHKGGIISEYEEGIQPLPFHFPQRNRIISGLSDLILVVEAKEKSGSLITVDAGLEQGKTVYAVPGRNGDQLSSGCNRLIYEGAGIATNVEILLEELGINHKKCMNMQEEKCLTEQEKLVYQALELQEKSLQKIIEDCQLEQTQVIKALFELLLKDYIVEPAKNHFARKM